MRVSTGIVYCDVDPMHLTRRGIEKTEPSENSVPF